MNPYVIDQLAEDRWRQLHALAKPRHARRRLPALAAFDSARTSFGSLLISWGAALLAPPEPT